MYMCRTFDFMIKLAVGVGLWLSFTLRMCNQVLHDVPHASRPVCRNGQTSTPVCKSDCAKRVSIVCLRLFSHTITPSRCAHKKCAYAHTLYLHISTRTHTPIHRHIQQPHIDISCASIQSQAYIYALTLTPIHLRAGSGDSITDFPPAMI